MERIVQPATPLQKHLARAHAHLIEATNALTLAGEFFEGDGEFRNAVMAVNLSRATVASVLLAVMEGE